MSRRGLRVSSLAELTAPRSVVTYRDGVWSIRIARLLRNVNAGNRHPHWSFKNRARRQWQAALVTAIVDGVGYTAALGLLRPKALEGACGGCQEPRRVAIVREVPSKRHLIRDEFDNLRWATKELRDALTGTGLIRDDAPEWCEMSIRQAVNADGQAWTAITIEPL